MTRRLTAKEYTQAAAPPAPPAPVKGRRARKGKPLPPFAEDPPLCPTCKRRDALVSVHGPDDYCDRCRTYQPGRAPAAPAIHLLAPSLTQTACGRDALALPRAETTGLAGRATCAECKQKDVARMLGNAEANRAYASLRRGQTGL